jgi:hypothetical protein
MARHPDRSKWGYWGCGNDGGIFAQGACGFYGSIPQYASYSDIVSFTPTPTGRGYWIVRQSGAAYTFGDAPFLGPVTIAGNAVCIAGHPTQVGYWILTDSGNVYTMGSVNYFGGGPSGSCALIPTADGGGYWIVSTTGNVTNHGNAPSQASFTASASLNRRGEATANSGGFWISDVLGNVYPRGANNQNSLHGLGQSAPFFIMSMAATGDGGGYWLVDAGGDVYAYGNAEYLGGL